MDYSGFTRSQNVEDERTGQLAEIVKLLTAPMVASYNDLTTHPFQKPYSFYEQLYLKNNPTLNPAQYSPLALQAGIQDAPGAMPFWVKP